MRIGRREASFSFVGPLPPAIKAEVSWSREIEAALRCSRQGLWSSCAGAGLVHRVVSCWEGTGSGVVRRHPTIRLMRRYESKRGGHFPVRKVAGVAGLEPVTSAVTGQRSNQLSYTPAWGGRVLYFAAAASQRYCPGKFFGAPKKVIRAAAAKEVGVENPAEETATARTCETLGMERPVVNGCIRTAPHGEPVRKTSESLQPKPKPRRRRRLTSVRLRLQGRPQFPDDDRSWVRLRARRESRRGDLGATVVVPDQVDHRADGLAFGGRRAQGKEISLPRCRPGVVAAGRRHGDTMGVVSLGAPFCAENTCCPPPGRLRSSASLAGLCRQG